MIGNHQQVSGARAMGAHAAEKVERGMTALQRASANAFRVFSRKNSDPTDAGMRIKTNTFCHIHHQPKFKLQRSSLFFTTGSCFAREVEFALEKLWVKLSAGEETFSYDHFSPSHSSLPSKATGPDDLVSRPRSPMNRYCPHSMLYDIERVLEDKHSFEDTIVRLDGGKVWDPQLKNLRLGDLNFALEMRGILDRIIRSIVDADVVIMTLGMTESWLDIESGAVLPTPPNPVYLKKFPQRFGYFEADYDNVLSTLTAIIAKIGAYSRKSPKIIVTVSPVPMGSTFSDKDVIVANSYSKSTLVSAAQTVAKNYDHVDYFPSYEMVVNSPRAIWHEDYIHIKQQYVAQIMREFTAHYFID